MFLLKKENSFRDILKDLQVKYTSKKSQTGCKVVGSENECV
jgi:hypothetical protein